MGRLRSRRIAGLEGDDRLTNGRSPTDPLWLMYTGRLAHARTFSRKNAKPPRGRWWMIPGETGENACFSRGLRPSRRGISVSLGQLGSALSEIAMTAPIRVLALHSHPDDIEFQCAGTLALLRERGLSPDRGHHDPRRLWQRGARCRIDRRDSPRASRRRPPTCSGRTASACEFRDLAIFNDDESRRA